MPGGRPTSYSQDVADNIITKLSEGITLTQICREELMPNRATVYDWVNDTRYLDFSQRFARAKNEGFDAIADSCFDIADDSRNDTLYTEFGPKENTEWVNRSKLRIYTRLQLLAKWSPKKYGDRIEVDGNITNAPIAPNIVAAIAEKLNIHAGEDTSNSPG